MLLHPFHHHLLYHSSLAHCTPASRHTPSVQQACLHHRSFMSAVVINECHFLRSFKGYSFLFSQVLSSFYLLSVTSLTTFISISEPLLSYLFCKPAWQAPPTCLSALQPLRLRPAGRHSSPASALCFVQLHRSSCCSGSCVCGVFHLCLTRP